MICIGSERFQRNKDWGSIRGVPRENGRKPDRTQVEFTQIRRREGMSVVEAEWSGAMLAASAV